MPCASVSDCLLIQESDARGVVFISGDCHLAELSRIELLPKAA
ncbi:MAG: hypothetical protein R3B96_03770 [Pirellulaceae bacterium]